MTQSARSKQRTIQERELNEQELCIENGLGIAGLWSLFLDGIRSVAAMKKRAERLTIDVLHKQCLTQLKISCSSN